MEYYDIEREKFICLLQQIEDNIKIPKVELQTTLSELKRVIFLNILFKEMNLNYRMQIINSKIILEYIDKEEIYENNH